MIDIHKANCGCEIHESGTENEVVFICASHRPDYGKAMIYNPNGIWCEHVVNICSTCGTYRTGAEWKKLEYVGRMDDEVENLELRNCTCGSTISIPVV